MVEFVCYFCLRNECTYCIDIMRWCQDRPLICNCKQVGHSGEPRDKQILDPTTGEIFAPGLKVTKEGKVKYSE